MMADSNNDDPNNPPQPSEELLEIQAKIRSGAIEGEWILQKLTSGAERASNQNNAEERLAGLQVLEMLGKSADGIDETVISSGSVGAILEAIGSAGRTSPERLIALSAIANLSCRSPPLRQVMVDQGATEALLSVATANDMKGEEHQKPALIGLINLSIDPINKPKMIEKGLTEAMMALSGDDDFKGTDIQSFSLNVLLSLSGSPPDVAGIVLQKGIVPVVIGVAQMKEGNSDRRHISALQILVNLSTVNPDVQVEVHNRGLAANLVDLARPPGSTSAVCSGEHLAWVLRLLVSLAQHPDLRPKLAELGLPGVLIGLINAPETKRTEHQLIAVDTLAALAKDKVASKAVLEGGLETLNTLAASDEYFATQVQCCALEALAALTAQDETARAAMVAGGSLDAVVKVAGDSRLMATTVQRPCVVALVNFSVDADGKTAMREQGAVGVLVAICKAEPCQRTDILLLTLKALAGLSACQDGSKASMMQRLLDEGSAEALLGLVGAEEYQGSEFQVVALQAVVNLCAGAGKTEQAMVAKGAVEAMAAVCASELLQRSAAQALALRALTNLSQNPETADALKERGAPAALRGVSEQGDALPAELVASAEEAIANLSVKE